MPRKRSILLAADDETTIRLIRNAYEQRHLSYPLIVAGTGSDAVHYLRQRGMFADTAQFPPPRLVLADLEMAGLGGLLIVRFVRKFEDGKLPVAVFGKPGDIRSFERASELGANERLFKPETPLGAEFFVSSIEERWLNEASEQAQAEERGIGD